MKWIASIAQTGKFAMSECAAKKSPKMCGYRKKCGVYNIGCVMYKTSKLCGSAAAVGNWILCRYRVS